MGILPMMDSNSSENGQDHGQDARATNPAPLFAQGGLDHPLARTRQPFGLIFLSHVLEHVPDPLALLGELRALTATGGWVYVEVPDAFRYAWSPELRGYRSPEHLWDFTPRYLEALAREAGWDEIRQHAPADPNCPYIVMLAHNPGAGHSKMSASARVHYQLRARARARAKL